MGVRYHRAADLVELTGTLQTTVSGLSIDEIAERFEVSRRTAERMLSALRERFPHLEPIFRSGRKYWKLPPDARTHPLQLPKTLHALTDRITRLELDLGEARAEADELRGIADGVLGAWDEGIVVIDAAFHAVWANPSLLRCLALARDEVLGCDMRSLVRERIRHLFEEPERFSQRVLGAYDTNSYPERFQCRFAGAVEPGPRGIEYTSRPIPTGRYAGGRVDHYVEVVEPGGRREATGSRDDGGLSASDTRGGKASRSHRRNGSHELRLLEDGRAILRDFVTLVRDAAAETLASDDIAPAVADRLRGVVASCEDSVKEAVGLMERGQMKFEPTAVSVVLRTAAALVEQLAAERGIHLHVEIDDALPRILADRAAITSAVTAAARNCIVSLASGRTVVMRAQHLVDPPRVRMSILDDGPSMPENLLGLEGRFTQTARGGLGLGITQARDALGQPTSGILQYFEVATERGLRHA